MSLPWFRMYHEFAGDPVIQGLAFEDQRHYVMVLCFKADGLLDREFPSTDFRHRVIARAIGLDPIAAGEARRRLMEFGLVSDDWQPRAWEKRQFKSDVSTGRVQKFRAKSDSDPKKESETDSDTDTEGNVSGNVSETLPRKRASKGTGIPEGFALTDDLTQYATERLPNVDVPELLAAFRDHHASKGTIAKDWNASWRTWARNAQKFGYPMIRVAPVSPLSKRERAEPTPEQISAARRQAAEDNKRQIQKVIGDVFR